MREMTTRKPSCKPSFPVILLAGVEGSGKTWAAVEATGSDAVDRSYFVQVGESSADEYGRVPGADFEIIEHDGTIGQIMDSIRWAAAQPVAEGKYPLLIVDSMTELWALITDNAQEAANARRRRNRKAGEDAPISMDLWNRAKDVWNTIVTACRRFPGPVIMTARLKDVAVVVDGSPTGSKDWKIEAEKSLPYSVQVVAQARMPRQWVLTKIVTTNTDLALEPGRYREVRDFTVTGLLDALGVSADTVPQQLMDGHRDGSLTDEAEQVRHQEAVARREREQAEQQEQVRKRFFDTLTTAEGAGDLETVQRIGRWAENQGWREGVQAAAGVRDRMTRAAA